MASNRTKKVHSIRLYTNYILKMYKKGIQSKTEPNSHQNVVVRISVEYRGYDTVFRLYDIITLDFCHNSDRIY